MKKKATIRIGTSHIEFRLDNTSYHNLQVIIHYVKMKIPEMRWNGESWQLPLRYFSVLYNSLQVFFQPKEIDIMILSENNNTFPHYCQLPLNF